MCGVASCTDQIRFRGSSAQCTKGGYLMAKLALPEELISLVHYVELNKAGWWDKAVQRLILATVWSSDKSLKTHGLVHELRETLGIKIPLKRVKKQVESLCASGTLMRLSSGQLKIPEEKLDEFGHIRLGGIGETLRREIELKTGYETRVSVLGHIQRGGSPTAFDRILGSRFGIHAIELIKQKKFGYMVALAGNKIISVPIEDAVKKLKTIDMEFYNVAKVFFG